MIEAEKKVIRLIELGQSGKYNPDGLIRKFAGRVRDVIKLRNPLGISGLVYEIDNIVDIINPSLEDQIKWYKDIQSAIKLFTNEVLHANRLLGILNDNEYDTRLFENVIMEKFMFQLKEKPGPNTIIKTDFKTMVELVELGVRRFGH